MEFGGEITIGTSESDGIGYFEDRTCEVSIRYVSGHSRQESSVADGFLVTGFRSTYLSEEMSFCRTDIFQKHIQ